MQFTPKEGKNDAYISLQPWQYTTPRDQCSNYVWLAFFILWYINLRGLFNAKVILEEEQQWYYLIHNWGDKGVHALPTKGISPKVNIPSFKQINLLNRNYEHLSKCVKTPDFSYTELRNQIHQNYLHGH